MLCMLMEMRFIVSIRKFYTVFYGNIKAGIPAFIYFYTQSAMRVKILKAGIPALNTFGVNVTYLGSQYYQMVDGSAPGSNSRFYFIF